MNDLVLLADKQSGLASRMILINKRHISEVRVLGNPKVDGAIVVMSNGREVHTAVTFDNLVQKLRS